VEVDERVVEEHQHEQRRPHQQAPAGRERVLIDSLLVRIQFIIEMIRWTGLAPWEFEFPFPGSLASTFLGLRGSLSVYLHSPIWYARAQLQISKYGPSEKTPAEKR